MRGGEDWVVGVPLRLWLAIFAMRSPPFPVSSSDGVFGSTC